MNRLRRVAAILLRQLHLLRGSPARVLSLFAWVAVDIVLWGFITRYLGTISRPGFPLVPTLLGAVLFWDFFSRVMHGVTMAFFEDVWSRNFLNLFATPLSVLEYAAGLVLASIATSAVGLAAMVLLASAAFGLSLLTYGMAALPFLLLLFLFGIALGLVASGVVLNFGPAAEWLIWPIPALLSPFVGVFYPLSVLPRWMQAVGRLLPPTYVFEGLRAIVEGGGPGGRALAMGGALAALYLIAAVWIFARVHRRAVRTGLIARYSAESVT